MIPLRDDNPTGIAPLLTWGFIALNVLVFFYQLSLGPKQGKIFAYQFGAIPAVVAGTDSLPASIAVVPAQFSLITNMFLHGGWMHLIMNMWYLWIFGDNIEAAMGKLRYLFFYLVCGILATLSHVLSDPSSVVPAIGASGAISGVLGAYLMLYPRARVLVLIPLGFFTRILYVQAGLVLGFYFVLQLLNVLGTGSGGGGIAFWAHIGGFIAGALLVGLFKKREVRFFNAPRFSRDTFDE